MRLLSALLLTACSLETGLSEETPDALPGDSGLDTPPDTQAPGPESCTVTLATARKIEPAKVCEAPSVLIVEPWNVEMEWQWGGVAEDEEVRHVIAMPAIGNLTDDDGDGKVTESDVPDVVFLAGAPTDFLGARSRLVVLDGATGEEHWSKTGFYWLSGVALADVDGDGEIEIITTDINRHPVALSATGEIEWTATVTMNELQDARDYPSPQVADLWGDGSPEAIFDGYILDGTTGALITELYREEETQYTIPTIGDVDRDGVQEIVFYNRLFEPDGTEVWQSEMVEEKGFWSAIVNVDEDDDGEVVMIGGGLLGIYEPDGTIIREVEVASNQPGPPCVADFDGDGDAEIAWANSTSLRLYELDGTEIWARSIVDGTGLAGCSGYDVNGDGAYEVLYADEETFGIYDGTSGSAKYTYSQHASGTVWEYPVVADIDGDLSAEIVFASNDTQLTGGWAGITALGHVDQGWLASGPTWHVHDFAVTNINADGSIPARPDPPWLEYNVFRARPAMDRSMGMDLVVEITDICADGDEPDDLVRIAVQVGNRGIYPVPSSIPIAVFSNDGASLSLAGLASTDLPIAPGTAADGMELTMLRADYTAEGITVRADELGAGIGIV
ncbi:MAG: hypothetical protein ACI8RZ_004351, partial [Myxococcota bacterium]